MGRVVLGGDLNSRCLVNGDTRVKACGRQLLEFCDDTALSMVTALKASVLGSSPGPKLFAAAALSKLIEPPSTT